MSDSMYEAQTNLEDAFRKLKWGFSFYPSDKFTISFRGVNSPSAMIERYISEIDDIIHFIEWNGASVQEEDSKAFASEIDSFVSRKSQEVALDFKEEREKSWLGNLQQYGLGRPWGTEIRRRLAAAYGLKNEVNSLLDMGLNSVAHSKSVTLGEHFIQLIRKEPAMKKIIQKIEQEIEQKIKSRAYRCPYVTAEQVRELNFSGAQSAQFGGDRAKEEMLQQLGFTLHHPVQSLTQYADTWNVAMNELTWAIRSATVHYRVTYHAVFNMYGYAYIWTARASLNDVYDLRPGSGLKIDFSATGRNRAYNIITSVLGTLYHDILGNSDNMRVEGEWDIQGNGEDKIHGW